MAAEIIRRYVRFALSHDLQLRFWAAQYGHCISGHPQ